MSKDPAFLFYSQDFITGTQFFSNEQVGKYIRLLSAQHQHGHLSEEQVNYICSTYDSTIMQKFAKDEQGFYFNIRLEFEINKRKSFCESRKNNINKRYIKGKRKSTYVKRKYIHMENENENENVIKDEIRKEILKGKTIPENLNMVELFFTGKGSILEDAANFYDYYSSNGWKVGGKAPMKDWQAAARRWIKNSQNNISHGKPTINKAEQLKRDFDEIDRYTEAVKKARTGI